MRCLRPYHVESTTSRPICQVKQRWAWNDDYGYDKDIQRYMLSNATAQWKKTNVSHTNLPGENEEVHPCEICGRNFVKNSLVKHEVICRKMAGAKRKVFDSGRQRATGSDIAIDNVINARKEREKIGYL
ncbi:unnamed protein product [Cercopithifilaria johnstoni]|uniref:C2HC/C3H-type domain-containing protein n=1 Tax=Cercopithifilaria johnstoni TaxID=2874296 RepID=A0A8J2PPV4_9BILA|nr:unnamed protein product [Cercopithifilaria johnstoni]